MCWPVQVCDAVHSGVDRKLFLTLNRSDVLREGHTEGHTVWRENNKLSRANAAVRGMMIRIRPPRGAHGRGLTVGGVCPVASLRLNKLLDAYKRLQKVFDRVGPGHMFRLLTLRCGRRELDAEQTHGTAAGEGLLVISKRWSNGGERPPNSPNWLAEPTPIGCPRAAAPVGFGQEAGLSDCKLRHQDEVLR
jgi:hypothetical protein